MPVIVVSRIDVERILTPSIAITLVDTAMRRVSQGDATQLVRRILPLPGSSRGFLGDMPGSLGFDRAFGLKCASIFPASGTGRAPHQGFLVLFEPREGAPMAVIEAGSVTAIRTAAATAVATRCLARPTARSLAILGAGEQAARHIPALLAAWPFEEVLIWARRPAAAEELAGLTVERFAVAARRVASPRDAARADVICTLTSAEEPFLFGEWISAGAHINLVGSSSAGPREVDSALITSARYFVDSTESALTHASEFLFALKSGLVAPTHIRGEIGAVLEGRASGRISETDITVYKSLGHIAQDLAVGSYVYERAVADGFGTLAAF